MRDLKFRVWDEDTEKLTYMADDGTFTHCFMGQNKHSQSCSLGLLIHKYNKKEILLEQFTGLRDKTGTYIYEGDILQDHVGCGVVEYIDKYAGFRVNYQNGRCKWFYDFTLRGERESIEVIGNIHQHPELLK